MKTSKRIFINSIEEDTLEQMVYYATKAPSGHNSQPWKFRFFGSAIEIYPDFDRTLPIVDPTHRELYISLGCALENLCIAATYYGFQYDWNIKTKREGVYYITVTLDKNFQKNIPPLFPSIESRQTNRSVYNYKLIPNLEMDTINSIPKEKKVGIHFYQKGTIFFEKIKASILKGNGIQMKDAAFKTELLDWIRFNKKQVEEKGDGLSYKVMGMPATTDFIGKQMTKLFLTPTALNKSTSKKIDSSSHFALITSQDNTPTNWIAVGIYLQRLLLHLDQLEIACAHLNPPCEISQLSTELQSSLPIDQEHPQIILRLGYSDSAPYSPRRLLSEVILRRSQR